MKVDMKKKKIVDKTKKSLDYYISEEIGTNFSIDTS